MDSNGLVMYLEAIDRVVRLSSALPESRVRLVYWEEEGNYQISLGGEPKDMAGLRVEAGGVVMFEGNWSMLQRLAMGVRERTIQESADANT